jgi:hypothetical protein
MEIFVVNESKAKTKFPIQFNVVYLISRSLIISEAKKSQRPEPVVDGDVDDALVDQVLGPVQPRVAAADAKGSPVDVNDDRKGLRRAGSHLFKNYFKHFVYELKNGTF